MCLNTVTHGLGKKDFDRCRGWVNKITVFFASLRYQPQVRINNERALRTEFWVVHALEIIYT